MAATVNGIYQKRSDEVGRLATLTVTGTEDVGYEAAHLFDDNPAKVFRILGTTGAVVLAYAAPQPIQLAGLIHTSLDAGLSVQLQGNTTNSFTSPAYKVAFTIPAWEGSGVTRWPVNSFINLVEQAAVTGSYNPSGYQYWRFIVIGTNSQNIEIGQLWLGSTIRTYSPNVDWEPKISYDRLRIKNSTSFKVDTIYRKGTNIWAREARIEDCPDTLRSAIHDQVVDVDGDVFPWLLVPDGLVNDCRLVRYTESREEIMLRLNDSSAVNLSVTEAGRGLRPGN